MFGKKELPKEPLHPQLKVPTIKVMADDCSVHVGRSYEQGGKIKVSGQEVFPHKGEYVEVIPVQSVSQIISLGDIVTKTDQTGYNSIFNMLCEHLARRVVWWDWTDFDGSPLPQPYHKPEVLALLSAEELLWLINSVQGELPDDRKKDSEPSTQP